MRKILSLSLILFHLSLSMAFAVTKADADALYEKEQYRDAAEAYETLMKQGGVASEVYYNPTNGLSCWIQAMPTFVPTLLWHVERPSTRWCLLLRCSSSLGGAT